MLENGLAPDAQRGELFKRFTSNHFLSVFGRPTEVEAWIGVAYRDRGLVGAFELLNEVIHPVLTRQLNNLGVGIRLDRLPQPQP